MIVENVTIKVSYNGKDHTSGVVSAMSWDDRDLKNALKKLFNCKENERIVGIDVTKTGIRAYFETK